VRWDTIHAPSKENKNRIELAHSMINPCTDGIGFAHSSIVPYTDKNESIFRRSNDYGLLVLWIPGVIQKDCIRINAF
jgi:hypothetical protein